MTPKPPIFDIFLATAPGLEKALLAEVSGKGFKQPKAVAGGVIIKGSWPEVWRANLWVRGANRVLARIATFRVSHLAQLDDKAHQVPWLQILRPDVSFTVETTCKKSRIYHSGAAAERIASAICDCVGAPFHEEASLTVMARIENDICTISVDTSGELLHKRGFKEAVNLAPMRETMASLFLLECGYTGQEPVYDPMCGSGTFVIESAEIAARLNPGRARTFAFEKLATFNPSEWEKMRAVNRAQQPSFRCFGSDRDKGAIAISEENAARAGVNKHTEFHQGTISEMRPPCEQAGLVIINPPYGTRIGEKKKLFPLYKTLGQTLKEHFVGWRVGLITTERELAHATGLPFLPTNEPVQHGGLRVTLFRTDALA